jgi:hypothetical protein
MGDHGRNGDGLDVTSQMGIINSLKTGNVVLDMVLAMCIPVFFKMLFEGISSTQKKLTSGDLSLEPADWLPRWLCGRTICERVIEHKTTQNMWGHTQAEEQDTRNSVIIKSVTLYLQELQTPFVKARVSLVSTSVAEQRRWYDSDSDDDERTPAGKLKKYRLTRRAPNNTWTSIGVYPSKKQQRQQKGGEQEEASSSSSLVKEGSKASKRGG